MASKRVLNCPSGPKPVGPYSAAVQAGPLIFISGQIPVDPATGQMVEGGIEEQTRRVMDNIAAILKDLGLDMQAIVRTTCYLRDLSLFQRFNQVYAEYFPDEPPARVTVEVSNLPKGALLEVDAIAWAGD